MDLKKTYFPRRRNRILYDYNEGDVDNIIWGDD
jgi:hypothetical protein